MPYDIDWDREIVVVPRHPALVDYLKRQGIVPIDVKVHTHADADTVRGKHVFGVLPHNLSCLCETFSEIPLRIPPELRGQELTLEQVEQYAGELVTYQVREV